MGGIECGIGIIKEDTMENQRHTFTVDELELVSFLREGKGALEAEVEVDWDPARWLKHLILIITARRGNKTK